MLSPSLHIKKKLEHPSPGLSACVHIVSLTSCMLLVKKRREKNMKLQPVIDANTLRENGLYYFPILFKVLFRN